MSPAEIANLVTGVCGTLVILARMRRYVTVDEYRAKVAELHREINDLRVRGAVLEERAKR